MSKTGLKSIFLTLSLLLILPDAFAWVSIQLDPAYLPADGESTVTITATVIGPGNPNATPPVPPGPRAGDVISFVIERGEGAIYPATTTTDINGQAFATFTAGTKPEIVIIRATDTTVGQFAHGFVTAFKVEIKASGGQSAPPKFIALDGTSPYYAKTLPIPLAGDFKWSIIKKKNAEIQGSAASQSVILKGITASKKVDDTGLKVMFKPAGAEDYAVDKIDVTVVGVEFNKEIVKAGISLINKDVRGTIKATITPKDVEKHITFDSTNTGRATVTEESRTNAGGNSKVVKIKVTGVTPTPAEQPNGDAELRALFDGVLFKSIKLLVVIPKFQTRSLGGMTISQDVTSNAPLVLRGPLAYKGAISTAPYSSIYAISTISIKDQFNNPLDSVYNSDSGVVFEKLTGNPQLESYIRYPSGQLKGGVVQDLIADILFENKLILKPNQENLWRQRRLSVKKNENGDLYVAPGGHYNIYLATNQGGEIVQDAVQELWVHGHKIEDKYRRQIKASMGETNFGEYVTDTKE